MAVLCVCVFRCFSQMFIACMAGPCFLGQSTKHPTIYTLPPYLGGERRKQSEKASLRNNKQTLRGCQSRQAWVALFFSRETWQNHTILIESFTERMSWMKTPISTRETFSYVRSLISSSVFESTSKQGGFFQPTSFLKLWHALTLF